jgi:hypothetical protein
MRSKIIAKSTIRRFAASLLVMGLGLYAMPGANAQNVPAEARDLARMLVMAGGYDVFASAGGTMFMEILRLDAERALARPLSDQESDRLWRLVTKAFKETVSEADWEAVQVKLLSRYYSPAELRDIAAFHRTRLGAKMLRLTRVFSTESAAAGAKMMNARRSEFGARLSSYLPREFLEFEREFERLKQKTPTTGSSPAGPGAVAPSSQVPEYRLLRPGPLDRPR